MKLYEKIIASIAGLMLIGLLIYALSLLFTEVDNQIDNQYLVEYYYNNDYFGNRVTYANSIDDLDIECARYNANIIVLYKRNNDLLSKDQWIWQKEIKC